MMADGDDDDGGGGSEVDGEVLLVVTSPPSAEGQGDGTEQPSASSHASFLERFKATKAKLAGKGSAAATALTTTSTEADSGNIGGVSGAVATATATATSTTTNPPATAPSSDSKDDKSERSEEADQSTGGTSNGTTGATKTTTSSATTVQVTPASKRPQPQPEQLQRRPSPPLSQPQQQNLSDALSGTTAAAMTVPSNGQQQQQQPRRQLPGSRLAESIKERMRSRAEPDAVVPMPRSTTPSKAVAATGSSNDDGEGADTGTSAAALNDGTRRERQDKQGDEEENFLIMIDTGVARKRVRVAQLLIIGLIGLLVGWLGNFLVSSSCFFAKIPVSVGGNVNNNNNNDGGGGNGQTFDLHFGLWKYSPVDSAMNGYQYCYPYSPQREQEYAPIVPRVVNLLALLAGTYSQVVLWTYLITGRAVRKFWEYAVYSSYAAAAFQLLTLWFFVGPICRNNSCKFGPAAFMAVLTAVAWLGFGYELRYNMPALSYDEDGDDATAMTAPCSESYFGLDRFLPPKAGEVAAIAASTDHNMNSNGNDDGSLSVSFASLEMADFQGASKEYIERFQRNGSPCAPNGTGDTCGGAYRPPELT